MQPALLIQLLVKHRNHLGRLNDRGSIFLSRLLAPVIPLSVDNQVHSMLIEVRVESPAEWDQLAFPAKDLLRRLDIHQPSEYKAREDPMENLGG
jgi:hypothetical protein